MLVPIGERNVKVISVLLGMLLVGCMPKTEEHSTGGGVTTQVDPQLNNALFHNAKWGEIDRNNMFQKHGYGNAMVTQKIIDSTSVYPPVSTELKGCMCQTKQDTLLISVHSITGIVNRYFRIIVYKGNVSLSQTVEADISPRDTTYAVPKGNVTFTRANYQANDTLFGKVFSHNVLQYEGKNLAEEIEGHFKCIVEE